MPPTSQEAGLRSKARRRIAEGTLPCTVPSHIDTGHGSGKPCVLCGQTVLPSDYQYKVEHMDEHRLLKVMRFHVVCHAIWQLECARCGYIKRGVSCEGKPTND